MRSQFGSAILIWCLCTTSAFPQALEGVVMRCGASTGQAFYFESQIVSEAEPGWAEDAISGGKILLVRLGDEWDIQFDDTVGSGGYRQDGAEVFPLSVGEEFIRVGAFHANYADIYTFNTAKKIVVWSSNKLGPITPKVAVYSAECE